MKFYLFRIVMITGDCYYVTGTFNEINELLYLDSNFKWITNCPYENHQMTPVDVCINMHHVISIHISKELPDIPDKEEKK